MDFFLCLGWMIRRPTDPGWGHSRFRSHTVQCSRKGWFISGSPYFYRAAFWGSRLKAGHGLCPLFGGCCFWTHPKCQGAPLTSRALAKSFLNLFWTMIYFPPSVWSKCFELFSVGMWFQWSCLPLRGIATIHKDIQKKDFFPPLSRQWFPYL